MRSLRRAGAGMSERFSSWFAIALTAIVLGTSWWYSENLRLQDREMTLPRGAVDSVADSIVLTGFDTSGEARYRLFAEHMVHFAQSDDLDLDHPRIVSMRPEQPLVEARAERAHAANNAQTVDLAGHVVLVRAAAPGRDGLRLRTETLHAIPDLDRFSTDDAVQIESGNSRVDARGMEFDNIARRLELRSEVHGVLPGVRR